jgi:hypothetical protein
VFGVVDERRRRCGKEMTMSLFKLVVVRGRQSGGRGFFLLRSEGDRHCGE